MESPSRPIVLSVRELLALADHCVAQQQPGIAVRMGVDGAYEVASFGGGYNRRLRYDGRDFHIEEA